MPWRNPIVGGEQLLLNSIQSPDYVPGVSGWIVRRDGSAEFNNVTIRGSLDVNGNVTFRGNNVLIVEDPDSPPLPLLAIAANEFTYGAATVHAGFNLYNNDLGDIISQFNISRDTFIGDTFLTLEGVQDPMDENMFIRFLPQPGLSGGITNLILSSGSYSTSVAQPTAEITLRGRSGDNGAPSKITLDSSQCQIDGALDATSTFTAANMVYGQTSVAGGSGAVTTTPITFPTLAGTGAVRGFAVANIATTAFVYASVSAVTASGANIHVLRNNATATTVFYHFYRDP